MPCDTGEDALPDRDPQPLQEVCFRHTGPRCVLSLQFLEFRHSHGHQAFLNELKMLVFPAWRR